MRAELGAEVTLIPEVERMRDAVVRLLERPHAEAPDVLDARHLRRRARTERRVSHAGVAHLADDVRDEVLDCAERRVRELERPLDLEAVARGELGEDDEGADLQRVVRRCGKRQGKKVRLPCRSSRVHRSTCDAPCRRTAGHP